MMDRNTPPPPYIAGAADDPEHGCSCHLHPPCGWCVEGGRGYEMFSLMLANGSWVLRTEIVDADDVTPDAIMAAADMVEWAESRGHASTELTPYNGVAKSLAPAVYAAGPHHPEHRALMAAAKDAIEESATIAEESMATRLASLLCECSAIGAVGRSMSWDHSPWCPAAGGSL